MAENYFRITSLEDGNQISIKAVGSPTAVNLQYRTSIAQTWQAYAIGTTISISTNEWIEFRNDTGTFSIDSSNYYNVTMTTAADASGSIMSLLDYNNMDIMPVHSWAFYGLFKSCTLLRNPPELPATSIGYHCYHDMFSNSGVIRMPALPAKNLYESCYESMFRNCQHLVEVSELPATTLKQKCYCAMFESCSSLTTAPELPATTLGVSCYEAMFYGCISLTSAPSVLPATTLAENCYFQMFQGCKSLTTTPELPATETARSCYFGMFQNCKSLTTAPELPATNTIKYCYCEMFSGCSALTTPPNLPALTANSDCYNGMFKDCTSLTTAPELPATTVLDYCYHSMFSGCTSLTTPPNLHAKTLNLCCYKNMFQDCTSLTNAPELQAIYLATWCCDGMFKNCSSLTTAPELPATNLANYCYQNMFQGCVSLTTAPSVLPATTLTNYCYQSMFSGCTSLTTPPMLPASSLAQYCYAYMFQNCTSLTEAPDMYATNFVNYCCQHMFNGCTNLNHIVWRSKTVPTVSFCNSWLVNASASGTFEYTNPLLDASSIERNVSGVPEGWNIQQLKPQAGGISLKINNIDVNKFMLLSKNISSLSINGVKVKSSTPIGTNVELPSHLTKLLYVDSNDGYLDTGVPTNGNLKVGIKWTKTKTGNSQWPEMFGNRAIPGAADGEYYQAFAFRCNTASGHYDYYHGLYSATNPRYGGRVDIEESSTTLGDTVHEYWMDPTRFSFDGQVFNTVDYANTHDKQGYTDWEYQPERLNGNSMVLFSSRTSNYGRNAIINCYNFYIVDTSTNTVLVNYVPCKYGTQAGFYDTVSQTFVTNSKFLAGPEA